MDSPFGIWIPQVTILRCHRLDDTREIDVLAGAVDAIDGQVERIDTTTFLFTPAEVSITHTWRPCTIEDPSRQPIGAAGSTAHGHAGGA